ncbi:L-seryl-tRNA(Sec) selenium transferase [Brevibacterium sanguinis]|uniref:L-seryl-tRNA(Sec) selenium transferase n=2 Tax=Brevibacterium TaxID=1696 RepID=A0A366ILX7_9MICO|nr:MULTISPECIES: L-seryl-tRNA(Sec) selenium transferase [Brevibacterium]RBP67203.1 L-seryl-tRNA(Sec) selenium transferase [Brevibacterium sanguinis]RBP73728.1 L-seryl-tRNA(Sec) selenium transferase [Brevibacterium celere]
MVDTDPRRRIPRTDRLLALPEVIAAGERLGQSTIRAIVADAQSAARSGRMPVAEVVPTIIRSLAPRAASSLTPVLNATGIIVHTNLGRAPLSDEARQAVLDATGYVDVEMDLESGRRSRRGTGARAALLRACPAAEDALVVNNGAAALLLTVTALAERRPNASGAAGLGEIIVSRGELVEIGAGFRLPDLMVTTGARLREVGTTNRTHLDDYARAISAATGCLLKVHTSNFRVEGFTAEVDIASLRGLADEHGLPLIADLGSGLFVPDPALPEEPDITTALEAGADVVIVSGDKLLGGPQAGLIVGRRDAVETIATHPLARAMRTDKLTLAALEATVTSARNPVHEALHIDVDELRGRTDRLATVLSADAGLGDLPVVAHDGRVGGGGAPGVPLPGWALELPEALAEPLRLGDPAIVTRLHQGRCLLDLRCVPETEDDRVAAAVLAAADRLREGRDDPEPRADHLGEGRDGLGEEG